MAQLKHGTTIGGRDIVAEFDEHKDNKSNPHNVTKEQIGLGNVDNVKQVSQIEFLQHINNKDNPHEVTKEKIGLGNVINVKQVSEEDFISHTSSTSAHMATPDPIANRIITRDSLGRAKVAAPSASDDIARKAEVDVVQGNLNAHVSSANNPHNVNKTHVGLGNVQNYGIATQAQAEAGTANNKYMTPLRTKQAIQALQAVKSISLGNSTFNSTAGRVITHNLGHTNYFVMVTPTANTRGYLGEVYVVIGSNSFTVYNTGSAKTAFAYLIIVV